MTAITALSDLDALQSLLMANQLPADDLKLHPASQFWGLGTPLYAAIGLETYGEMGLIRSLIVATEQRRQGLGQQLVAWVEQQAKQMGLGELYLLTTTAPAFFESLGYERIERRVLPTNLHNASQVKDVCPASAAVLRKVLG